VILHSSSFVILSVHFILFIIRLKHLFTNICSLLVFWLVVFQVSQAYNDTDFTFVLKIRILGTTIYRSIILFGAWKLLFLILEWMYRGADKSLAQPDWKNNRRSAFFVRRGDHCCRGDLVGRTTFWIFFEWFV